MGSTVGHFCEKSIKKEPKANGSNFEVPSGFEPLYVVLQTTA